MTPEQRIALDEVNWEGGSTIEEFFEDFPTVTRAQAVRFIELAKERILECVSS